MVTWGYPHFKKPGVSILALQTPQPRLQSRAYGLGLTVLLVLPGWQVLGMF
jgi:hypothetical protein